MMFRVAIGEISHETNTFCAPTTLQMFRDREWDTGEGILARHRGIRTYVGGMIEAAEHLGIVLRPTLATRTDPWGTITHGAFAALIAELTAQLRRVMPFDAVCLALHGAGVAEDTTDLEGSVLEAVREIVGPAVPIAATLDLHANVTPKMAALANGLFGVHEYPHVDAHDRGREVMAFLLRVLRGEVRPALALESLPLLIPPSPTAQEPTRSINALCRRWEAEPGMIDCVFFHGFSHTDIPQAGVAVLALAERNPLLARRAACDVAWEIWARRDAFQVQHPGAREAVAEAKDLSVSAWPVVIHEMSDNPGGGAPGDGTHLLRAMLEAGLEESAFGTIYDPEVAEISHRAGVGSTFRVRLGGKHDPLHGDPIAIEACVKSLSGGQYRLTTPMGRGRQIDLGRTACLACGGLDVVVASQRRQVLDPGPFLLHGIDVSRCRIVGLKSSAHFRAGFEGIVRAVVTADPPGITSANLRGLPYRRIRRPIYPLDADACYVPDPRRT